jgi:NADH-quinone oxidoreductase subunit L
MTIGGGAALFFYKSGRGGHAGGEIPPGFNALTGLKESFDRLYDYYVAKVQQRFAMVLNFLEQIVLAGAIIRGLAGFAGLVGYGARALYTGSLQAYAYWFLLGAALLWAFAAGLL